MSDLAKREYFSWLQTLEQDKLSPHETTMINIITENLDDVCKVGTASGKRAKLIVELIDAKKNKTDKNLVTVREKDTTESRIKKLVELNAKRFRGFYSSVSFDLNNRYTFFHGTNGSGKSSFCEALEFSLLGVIEEADARNIPLNKYIIHAGEQNAELPVLTCKYDDDSDGPSLANYEAYRFAFLEKNRIDKFSYISAATEKNQSKRIAALFGLTEFNKFIGDFTEHFDNYINLTRELFNETRTKAELYEKNKEKKAELNKEKTNLSTQVQAAIGEINDPEIQNMQEAIDFLGAPESGRIAKLHTKKATESIEIINIESYQSVCQSTISLLSRVDTIRKLNNELAENIHSVNLLDLYKSVEAIESEYKNDYCPVCKTPLANVVKKPFEYAKEQVHQLSHIEDAKKKVDTEASFVQTAISDLNVEINKQKALISLFDLNECIEKITNIDKAELIVLSQKVELAEQALSEIKNAFSKEQECKEKIIQYNKKASEKNTQLTDDLSKVTKIHERLIELKTKQDANEKSTEKIIKEISAFEEENKAIQEKIDKEKSDVEYNQKMLEAYNSIRDKLVRYQENLPAILSENLSQKTAEFYNVINKDDAEFEKVEYFKLPMTSADKIIVKLKDCVETDALQVLSEGHIRALGLSLLLAKAVAESQPFLIFDDIVNAIDDDHRNGVAELIINGDDFKDKQLVITCHGEQFVVNLEDKLESTKDYARFMFMPADSLDERGIVIKHQEAQIPLQVARAKYDSHELREAASKCRQATECIVNRLWYKLSNTAKIMISVAMRNPKSTPDLNSIVDGLIKATKPSKMSEAENINDLLCQIKSSYNWLLMNKGTHFSVEQPEFTRPEIKNVLELLEALDTEVKNVKFSITVK